MGGNQSVPKITPRDRAILDMKLQRDKLKQYQKNMQRVLNRERQIAQQHLANGHKDRALTALRQRKYQETLLTKTYAQLEQLEQLVSTIEFSLAEMSVLHGLKTGNEALKQINKEMNLEDVEKLMEETQEARTYQQEISDMLANNLTLDDEEAVQEEFRQLQALSALETRPEQVIKLPDVPDTEPVPVKTPEPQVEEPVRERVPIFA